MKRRDILKLAPAALAAGAAPAAALCVVDPAETPIAILFREWEVHTKAVNAACDDRDVPDDVLEKMIYRQTDLEDEIARTPARNLRDFAMKIFARSTGGMHEIPSAEDLPDLWAGVRALVA